MLSVYIKINEYTIKHLHAVRVEGTTEPDSINSYQQVVYDKDGGLDGYLENFISHRYGDGAEKLAIKMLEEWK